MKKIKLNVDGMHCHSCETLIEDTLKETKGILNAEVNYKKGIVNVEFDDSKIKEKVIIKSIEKEGYKVARVIQ